MERERGREGDNRHTGFGRKPRKAPIRTSEPREGAPFDTVRSAPHAKLPRPGCKTVRNEGFTQEIRGIW